MSQDDLGPGEGTSFTAPVAQAPPNSRHRSLIIAIFGGVIVIALVIAGIFIFDEASAALSAGSGTATITWVSASNTGQTFTNPPQAFAGSIGGHGLTGVATTVLPTNSLSPYQSTPGTPKTVEIFHYKGTFAEKPFNIGVSFKTPLSLSSQNSLSLIVNGTCDGQAVHAVVTGPSNSAGADAPVPFNGTIGKWKVSGTIHCCSGTKLRSATASYTVSS